MKSERRGNDEVTVKSIRVHLNPGGSDNVRNFPRLSGMMVALNEKSINAGIP